MTHMRLCAAVLAAVALLVAGCGEQAPKTPKRVGLTGAGLGNSGRLVAIGGGRSLYLACTGSGSPTVVLEAGFGGSTMNWGSVQPQLGRTTRTCAYDRAGLGSSVAMPGVHDADAETADLQRLLQSAGIKPPYVLVGHSYGGLLVRLFAQAHPDETAGVVLVDAMGRDQTRRMLHAWPKAVAPRDRRSVAEPVTDGVDLRAGEALAARVRSLGGVPLAVVTAGTHTAEYAGLPRRLRDTFDRMWATMQDELAALSSDHLHVVALHSDHFVQNTDGQPDVVVRAVGTVVRAARDGTRLPPCPRLFSGPAVRCRA